MTGLRPAARGLSPARDPGAPTCRGLPVTTPLAAGKRAAPPRRTSARAAQVGAELHARPASCMTRAGRSRAAGSARSLHHPARGRRLTGHVTRRSRALPRLRLKALLWRPEALGRRGGGGGGRPVAWRCVRLLIRLHLLRVEKGKTFRCASKWKWERELSGETFVCMDEQGFCFVFALTP